MKKLHFSTFIFVYFFLNLYYLNAQDDIDIEEYAIGNSPHIELKANAVLLHENEASVYLRWGENVGTTPFLLSYKEENAESWTQVEVDGFDSNISGLTLGSSYIWKVSSNGGTTKSDEKIFRTECEESIEVSTKILKEIQKWSSKEGQSVKLTDYLDSKTDISIFERTSFLQKYFLDCCPVPFLNSIPQNLDSWVDNNWCKPPPPVSTTCNCHVMTDGGSIATPNRGVIASTGIINPVDSQFHIDLKPGDTFIDVIQKGASKYFGLRMDERDGKSGYEINNLLTPDDPNESSFSPNTSSIQFFLACSNGLRLPEDCPCTRTIDYRYEYSTNLRAYNGVKWSFFSTGSEATAEDMAMTVIYSSKDNETEVLSAGQAMVSRGCGNSWNPDFWVEILDIAELTAAFLVQENFNTDTTTMDSTSLANYLEVLPQLVDELQNLLTTSFRDVQGGGCDEFVSTAPGGRILNQGNGMKLLRPNETIVVSTYSYSHLEVRGWGGWTPSAAVASDYFLAGVVQSEVGQGIPDECCSDKFGTHTLGASRSQSNADVPLASPNNTGSLLQKVGFFLQPFGPWPSLSQNSGNGQITGIGEFGRYRGPSCIPYIEDYQQFGNGEIKVKNSIHISPNIASDKINIYFKNQNIDLVDIYLFDMNGKVLKNINNYSIKTQGTNFDLSISDIPQGGYIVSFLFNKNKESFKIIKI